MASVPPEVYRKRVARYSIIVVRSDTPDPQLIISDYWQSWVEDVYISSRLHICQVYTPLGRGYFPDEKPYIPQWVSDH